MHQGSLFDLFRCGFRCHHSLLHPVVLHIVHQPRAPDDDPAHQVNALRAQEPDRSGDGERSEDVKVCPCLEEADQHSRERSGYGAGKQIHQGFLLLVFQVQPPDALSEDGEESHCYGYEYVPHLHLSPPRLWHMRPKAHRIIIAPMTRTEVTTMSPTAPKTRMTS